MNQTSKLFFNMLFNEDEQICVTDVPQGVSTCSLQLAAECPEQYFAINPLTGPRKDDNVSVYRNILCEFDEGSKEEQLKLIHESGLPFTCLTWSGGKSVHAIISLQEPCQTKDEYKRLVARIYDKLPGVDRANSNPSRLSRTAGATRANRQPQDLLILRAARVSRDDLNAWLGPEAAIPVVKYEPVLNKLLSGFTMNYLSFGSSPGQRNKDLFNAACDMLRAGHDEMDIYARTLPVADLPAHEVRATIKSATRTVRNGNS